MRHPTGVPFAEINSDPAAGVTILAAFGAGIVSFLSPCVLPLVPGYLSAVSGVSPADLDDAGWRRVLVPSLLFVASFSAIFIVLGLTATGLGSFFQDHDETLTKISAALIIAMGVLFVAALFVPRLDREWHVDAPARAGREGRPAGRRRRLRDRLDPLHRPDSRRDPLGGGAHRSRRRAAPSCSPSTRPASRSRSCSPPSPSRG